VSTKKFISYYVIWRSRYVLYMERYTFACSWKCVQTKLVRKFSAATSATEEVPMSCLCAVLIEVRGEVWYDERYSESREEREKRKGREIEKVTRGRRDEERGRREKNAITTLGEERRSSLGNGNIESCKSPASERVSSLHRSVCCRALD